MGANIITGYTGTRHITPAMDAAVYRSVFGENDYILSDGNQLAGSMPSVNEFTVLDGLVSMQGHQIQITQETLSVDTCANGYERIDLVVCRFEHDNESLIDSSNLVVIKGQEVQSGNTPTPPAHNTGIIDQGASIVDMPLYQINLNGSSVTFSALYDRSYSTEQLRPVEITTTAFSSLPLTITDVRIMSAHKVKPHDYLLSNPSAMTGDWEITTSDGSMTVTGSMSGSTTAIFWLTIPLD